MPFGLGVARLCAVAARLGGSSFKQVRNCHTVHGSAHRNPTWTTASKYQRSCEHCCALRDSSFPCATSPAPRLPWAAPRPMQDRCTALSGRKPKTLRAPVQPNGTKPRAPHTQQGPKHGCVLFILVVPSQFPLKVGTSRLGSCRPLRPVLLLVSFPRSRSPVVGVLGLCSMWRGVPFASQRLPKVGVLRMCWLLPGSFDCFCCPRASVHRLSIACLAVFLCA